MRKLFGLLFLTTSLTLAACGEKDGDDDGDGGTKTGDDGGGDGGGGGNVLVDFCDAYDECNMLEGMSASECVDDLESCEEDLLTSEVTDFEDELQDCVDTYTSCDELYDCYWDNVPYC